MKKRLHCYPCSNPECQTMLDIQARQIVVDVGASHEAYCCQDCADEDDTQDDTLPGRD